MRKFLLVFALAVLAGTGLTAAQAADDPPGAAYQDQGIREWLGGSVHRNHSLAATGGSYGAYATSGVYNDLSDRAPARRQATTRRKHVN
jgi:hypothetical protein